MSLDALTLKRVRRTFEPEDKTWNDDSLDVSWEEIKPPLSKITIFSLKNIFFFSHATPIQASTYAVMMQSGVSALVEAPTGSGKTLAFLVPLMERALKFAEQYTAEHQRPPLTRNILGIIVSPSRALAEQTYVTGRNLAARYPHNIHFNLCDGALSRRDEIIKKLQKSNRGVGSFLVTTPRDLGDMLEMIETNRAELSQGLDDSQVVDLFSTEENRFMLVVDEADLVFNNERMRTSIETFVDQYAERNKKGIKKKPKKDSTEGSRKGNLLLDFCFVGATVSSSPVVQEYLLKVGKEVGSEVHIVSRQRDKEFLSQLRNRFVVCYTHSFLSVLVQIINMHSSKKHFIFFNSSKVLVFVERLLKTLSQGDRPLLFVPNIYVMHEQLTENTRMEQYSQFLTPTVNTTGSKAGEGSRPPPATVEKKNKVFQGGLKRSCKRTLGCGAILLCTDMAAFGLDVRDVDYVYHFQPPTTAESYVHRTGRVGRMGLRGSTVLLLPVLSDTEAIDTSRERKTTSNRFNTATNTKQQKSSHQFQQSHQLGTENLDEAGKRYLDSLSKRSKIEEFSLPPIAPISSTIRNIILSDEKLLKMCKIAAMAMGESSEWFTPKIAVQSLLLD